MGKSHAAVSLEARRGGSKNGHSASGTAAGPVDPDEQWLKSWAYATSPHGLGLTTRESWERTPREIAALSDVHRHALTRWAIERMDFRNVHFRNGPAWTVEDLLGGDRAARVAEWEREQQEVKYANLQLEMMKAKIRPRGPVPQEFEGTIWHKRW